MPSRIQVLPDNIVNKIAAGEVVERPSSVVKELAENSLDAGATEILVDIEQAGRRLIRITDNGCGMQAEDARTAFFRHATSKIRSDADLDAVRTMGFRGEALSSIASVSRVRLLTAERGSAAGTLIEIEGGTIKQSGDAAAPPGTSLEVSHLFFNTPARLKFLKSPATEFSHIVSALSRQAMAHPGVRFRLTHNRKTILDLPPSRSLRERVFQVYGSELADHLIEFSGGSDSVRVHGLLSRPGYTRADKTYQDFYVNGRPIRNASLSHALYSAYGDLLMRDRNPAALVFIDIDPGLVDVNVHPAKAEVRFRNQSQIHDLVRDVIREALAEHGRYTVRDPGDRVLEAVSAYLSDPGLDAQSPGYPAFPGRGGVSPAHPPAPANTGTRQNRQENIPLSELPVPGADTGQPESAGRPFPRSEQLFPLAQIHDSFIIAQSTEGMAIIDQHAAHERVLFERLQDQFRSENAPVQHLLIPEQIELGPAESALLADCLPDLARIGMLVEHFGSGTFVIKAVPALLAGGDYRQLLRDILDEVGTHGTSSRIDGLRDEILSVMACHPAVKVHRKLEIREMENLLADLFRCRMPHSCPHGRPTIVRITRDELHKLFKRL